MREKTTMYDAGHPEVDKIKLAQMMIKWYHEKRALQSTEYQIKSMVLRLGETVDVANIRCTFNSGRTKYESWEQACSNASHAYMTSDEKDGFDEFADYVSELVDIYSTEVVTIKQDFKPVCEALGIEREVVSHGTPSATLKVIDD
jgi:hypothetical protein